MNDKAIEDALSAANAAVKAQQAPTPEPSSQLLDTAANLRRELEARIGELEEELETARAELDAKHDRLVRAVADHENAKKRATRDTEEAIAHALLGMLSDILPVGDNLARALAVASPGNALSEGVHMVKTSFDSALAKQGITPIEAVGKPFDPALHEALQQVVTPDHQTGTVIQVFERGYMRGDKLFRAARVVVAAPGSGTTD